MSEDRFIYALTIDGKIMYVGQTKSIARRYNEHLRTARVPKSQRAMGQKKLYEGLTAVLSQDPDGKRVDIIQLERCAEASSNERERYWIGALKMHETGWNVPLPGGPGREKGCSNPSGPNHYLYGKNLPRETVEKLRAARTGKPMPAGHGEKIKLGKMRSGKFGTKVVIRDDGLKFKSLTDAAASVGCTISAITLSIKKECRAKGHYWSYE